MTDMPRVVQASGGTVDRSHHNNFDAIRIAAAFAVLYSHQFALTGRPEPSFFGLHSWGGIAVIVFFVVSGFLVTGSWYNDPNVLRFSARRILRLWPALTAVVVLTAYGLGAWVTTLPLGDYWTHEATRDYLNILRMQIYYVLPGVFEGNPYARDVNGSLWTIPLEVRCYVVLAIAGLLQLMRWRIVWLGCIALYMAWFITKSSADVTGHVHYGRELSAFFLAGSALFVLRQYWERRPLAWLLGLGAAAALLWAAGWRFTATLVFIPLLVLYAGTRSTPVIRRFGRFGDPSYGAYLIAFPVQQTVIHFLYPQLGLAATLLMAAGITFALAYASWHAIEQPALRLKPRRRPPYPPKGYGPPPHKHGAPTKASHAGLPLALLSCSLAIAGQTYYTFQAHTGMAELIAGTLPTLGAALLLCGALTLLGRARHSLLGNTLRIALVAMALLAAVATLVAAIGFWQTGSIPRIQQLHGLTWNIVEPSILEIARRHAIALALGLASLVLALWLLRVSLRRPHRAPIRSAPLAALGLAALVTGLGAAQLGATQGTAFIATQLFYSDLDIKQALSGKMQQKEARFFEAYHHDLAQLQGPPRYPDILAALRGSNIIWVVLESVRAKDLPVYGGSADMPHLMQAREHMLLLDHLYVQDPRSTKAYTQMDLGRFSLLSWDTYSNNIPWMFPEEGIASRLDKLGYSTIALVNSDANYDNNQLFQQRHGYQQTMYRQALNPGSPNADDLQLLEHMKSVASATHKPFYMMVWPVQTHHPYGREYWSRERSNPDNKAGETHSGMADYPRYLKSLREADDWFGRLLALLKTQGLDTDTTIIVTGDHGQAFAEHEPGNVFHGNGVYEESVHIPGFIYHPKINGPLRDERNITLLDIPAPSHDMTTGADYVLTAGRSIMRNYRHEMPIFLFNSWAGAIGIIEDGHKLWRRVKSPKTVFFASMQEIREDPRKERQPLKAGQGQAQLDLLNRWEAAMMARSARLLTQATTLQSPLNDVIRVYCDDGNGFTESHKGVARFAGFAGKVIAPIGSECRALRIAPIKDTTVPEGAYLDLNIASLEVTGGDKSWTLDNLAPVPSNSLEVVNRHEFRITGSSSFIDYRLDSINHGIQQVMIDASYAWGHRQLGPQAAVTPGTHKTAP